MSLRDFGLGVHRAVASSPAAARIYLAAIGLLKGLPDGRFKRRLMNNLSSVKWPRIDLPAREVRVGGKGFRIVPHLGEFEAEALLMKEIAYEKEVFAFLAGHPRRYDAVIEIGANVGIYTLFFSALYRQAQVYAFEPSREAYSRLLKNIALNGPPKNVHTLNAAVSDATGFESFYEPAGHLVNGSLRKDFASIFSRDVAENTVLTLEAAFLAGLFEKHRAVLLKIDAEGSETRILKSLLPLLRTARPDVLVECLTPYEMEMNGLGLEEIYTLYQITPNGARPQASFRGQGGRDYMLVAKESAAGI